MMASVLVTGSTRGLGFELVKQLLLQPTTTIATAFFTGRQGSAPKDVQRIIHNSNGRAHYLVLDVSDDDSVSYAVLEARKILGTSGLDVIINNAGSTMHEGAPSQVRPENMEKIFSANVSTIQRVTSSFLPLLEQGQLKKILNITSTLGSMSLIKNFALADVQSYKISKAAVNMLTSLWALELGPKGFTVFMVNPGWLKTDLGGEMAELEVSQGANQVVKILMEAIPGNDNGAFRDIFIEGHATYSGTNQPW